MGLEIIQEGSLMCSNFVANCVQLGFAKIESRVASSLAQQIFFDARRRKAGKRKQISSTQFEKVKEIGLCIFLTTLIECSYHKEDFKEMNSKDSVYAVWFLF